MIDDDFVDFYGIGALLTDEEQAVRTRVRQFVLSEVEPVINTYWERAEFPLELIPKLASLGIMGYMVKGYGCPGLSPVAGGLVMMELSRGDGSISSIYGIQNMVIGSIAALGSEEQRCRWLPELAAMCQLGCFALTESKSGTESFFPDTIACPADGGWVLRGTKRWVGDAAVSDIGLVWAREERRRGLVALVVDLKSPGCIVRPMGTKISKRAVVNCEITFEDCFVPSDRRLEGARRFRDVERTLLVSRLAVAWESVGHAMAAYERARAYACERLVSGKPLAGFQLVQDKLVRMLAALTSMQLVALQASKLLEAGGVTQGQASLAKLHNAGLARQVVALGREVFGGNGVLLENHVARHFADLEAVYTYEGTQDVHTLVVGREITGHSALM